MKKAIGKKLVILLITLVLFGVGIGLVAAAKIEDSNKDREAALQLVEQRKNPSFLDFILNFFNFNKPKKAEKAALSQEEIKEIQNKTSVVAAEAGIHKRDIISKPEEVKNGDYILKTTDTFEIVYAPAPDSFFIYLKSKPVSKAKTEAEQWFKDQGFKSEQVCGLGIHFVAKIDKPTDSEKDVFKQSPTGCP